MTTRSKFIVLDRDGIINYDSPHYIKSADELILIPGSLDAIARLTKAGYRMGVATNQSGITRGYFTEEGLAAIHQKMIAAVEDAGGCIEAIIYCPHLPEEGCFCRKPQPGMLHELARRFDCKLTDLCFIGDRASDVQAAKNVGAQAFFVFSPMTDIASMQVHSDIPTFSSLAECVDHILGVDHEN